MPNPYKVFHSDRNDLKKAIHVILVRPEISGNVGSVARAMANMDLNGEFILVASPDIVNGECLKLAKHAASRFESARFVGSLSEALANQSVAALKIAATARVGSPHRPHPLRVREAMEKAVEKLVTGQHDSLYLIFGPESDGLSNEEIDLCDWVVTIPSSPGYRSLNLAQSVLIFGYEVHMNLLLDWTKHEGTRISQKDRLAEHLIRLAETVGFVLPGDPKKMRPRLEEIFSHLPNHIKDVKTLHGLIDQTIRSVHKGEADFKGIYRHWVDAKKSSSDVGKQES